MPEILWKAYIDFEVEEGERAAARALYERLIALSGHVKVWISYALFEAEAIPLPRVEREEEEEEEEDEDEEKEAKMVPGDQALARQVFEKGYKDLKSKNLKSERVALLEVWKTFEQTSGSPEDVKKVEGMMPIVTKKRHVDQETGQMVEDWDLVFADDERESNPTSFKFMQMAHAWKQAQAKGTSASSGTGASTFLSGFTPATVTQKKVDNSDSDEDNEAAGGHIQRPGGHGNDEDASSSEDEGDED